MNPRRRYNNCKYLCTQHRSTEIHKANANSHKGEIDCNTIIVGNFTHHFHRSSKTKINKDAQALNHTLNKMDLIDIYRIFHPKTTEYTLFSSDHGTFSRIDHILGQKSSLGKFKKIEIISSIFSD